MVLTTVQDIERAIDALPAEQLEELYDWLDEHHAQTIDVSLKADLDAGRFDERINQAVADHEAGNAHPL